VTPARPAGGSRLNRRTAVLIVLLCVLGLAALIAYRVSLQGKTQTGVLYFTTFDHQALYSAGFAFHGGHVQFRAEDRIAALPKADGVVFSPGGRALVGGQDSGDVLEVDTGTGAFRAVPSGCPNAFLQALAPKADLDYTAGNPGSLCAMQIDPLRPGHEIPLTGDDSAITELAFDDQGHGFYTTAGASGIGNFGSIDVSKGQTTRFLTQVAAAHGLTFDPLSRSLYLFGGETIYQIDPRHPLRIESSLTVPDVLFDQGTTDGQGHLFVASNRGQLVVIDTGLSGQLSGSDAQMTTVFLRQSLDDIAPLEGPGTHAAPAKWWIPWAGGALIAVALLAVLSQVQVALPRRRLPAWDVRRQEEERRRRHQQRTGPRGRPGQRRR